MTCYHCNAAPATHTVDIADEGEPRSYDVEMCDECYCEHTGDTVEDLDDD